MIYGLCFVTRNIAKVIYFVILIFIHSEVQMIFAHRELEYLTSPVSPANTPPSCSSLAFELRCWYESRYHSMLQLGLRPSEKSLAYDLAFFQLSGRDPISQSFFAQQQWRSLIQSPAAPENSAIQPLNHNKQSSLQSIVNEIQFTAPELISIQSPSFNSQSTHHSPIDLSRTPQHIICLPLNTKPRPKPRTPIRQLRHIAYWRHGEASGW